MRRDQAMAFTFTPGCAATSSKLRSRTRVSQMRTAPSHDKEQSTAF